MSCGYTLHGFHETSLVASYSPPGLARPFPEGKETPLGVQPPSTPGLTCVLQVRTLRHLTSLLLAAPAHFIFSLRFPPQHILCALESLRMGYLRRRRTGVQAYSSYANTKRGLWLLFPWWRDPPLITHVSINFLKGTTKKTKY